MREAQPAVSLLRNYLRRAHEWMEGTMADVTPALLHDVPPGNANPIGAQYAHVLTAEDGFVNMIIGGEQPLMATSFAGKTGMSEPMPLNPAWGEWALRVRIDLPAIRSYAQALYVATDTRLAGMTDADLSREIDLSHWGIGDKTTVGELFGNVLINTLQHCGEISALKGLHGLKGYVA